MLYCYYLKIYYYYIKEIPQACVYILSHVPCHHPTEPLLFAHSWCSLNAYPQICLACWLTVCHQLWTWASSMHMCAHLCLMLTAIWHVVTIVTCYSLSCFLCFLIIFVFICHFCLAIPQVPMFCQCHPCTTFTHHAPCWYHTLCIIVSHRYMLCFAILVWSILCPVLPSWCSWLWLCMGSLNCGIVNIFSLLDTLIHPCPPSTVFTTLLCSASTIQLFLSSFTSSVLLAMSLSKTG